MSAGPSKITELRWRLLRAADRWESDAQRMETGTSEALADFGRSAAPKYRRTAQRLRELVARL